MGGTPDDKIEIDRSYIPECVKLETHAITREEAKRRELDIAFSSGEMSRHVEVLDVEVHRVWYLNPCGPDCCEPKLVIQVGKNDIVTLLPHYHGLGQVFADDDNNFKDLTTSFRVIRSERAHLLLDVLYDKTPVPYEYFAVPTPWYSDAFSQLRGCEFIRIDRLSPALRWYFFNATER